MNDNNELFYNFYIVGKDYLVEKMLRSLGHNVVGNINDQWDIALFTGGEDVFPPLYGERVHKSTCFNLSRDLEEVTLFRQMPLDIPKVGICRGGQFLNVMSGGRMYQNVNNHAGQSHLMTVDFDQSQITVTSTHHQMMRPAEHGWIMAYAEDRASFKETFDKTYRDNEPGWENTDAEVVWYNNTNSLCFQPHPEYSGHKECRDFFFQAIDILFAKDIAERREKLRKATLPN